MQDYPIFSNKYSLNYYIILYITTVLMEIKQFSTLFYTNNIKRKDLMFVMDKLKNYYF